MSIDINWDTITSGTDGEALAERIRSFVHDKFQQVTLPGFIRSVEVHSFDFGKICPQLEIKDIGDPLPDFYDGDDDDDGDGQGDGDGDGDEAADGQYLTTIVRDRDEEPVLSQDRHEVQSAGHASRRDNEVNAASLHAASIPRPLPPHINPTYSAMRSPFNFADQLGSAFPRSGTPGIPGGTSNLSYFHLPLGGLSGTQTPLAAVASGTNYPSGGWLDVAAQGREHHNATRPHQIHTDYESIPSTRPSTAASLIIAPPSPAAEISLPLAEASPHLHSSTQIPHLLKNSQAQSEEPNSNATAPTTRTQSQPSPSDLQIITHVKYAGDIRLTLTAEILLDYPMPSFVGIPLKLSITGLTFDGVAVLASIRKNLHFCFLAPDDAEMLVGGDDEAPEGESQSQADRQAQKQKKSGKERVTGGLLEEIRVESEIGKKEGGKQVLKNVGKVERFVLEQVRRIFEDEFVFPSFWTFLV
jgi:mitochondrial distribution and morphology protein 12